MLKLKTIRTRFETLRSTLIKDLNKIDHIIDRCDSEEMQERLINFKENILEITGDDASGVIIDQTANSTDINELFEELLNSELDNDDEY